MSWSAGLALATIVSLAPASAFAFGGPDEEAVVTLQRRPDAEPLAPGLEEKLIALLPGPVLESVARTFADRTLELQLSSDRAFVLVRIPWD